MTVEFGVLIPTRESVMSGRMETAPLLTMAERAEAAGFDSVWIGGSGPTALREAARFDAWFPTGPSVEFFAEHFPKIQAAAPNTFRFGAHL